MPQQRRTITLSCVAALACGGGARSGATMDAPSRSRDGVYEYTASIPGAQAGSTIRVQGTLAFVDDSLVVHPDGNCGVAVSRVAPIHRLASLNCGGGATLTLDLRNGASGTWSTMVSVPKQRNACVEYAPRDPARSPRCIRWRPETYYVRERRSGPVRIRLIQ
jgi:hypothetical protein